MNAKLVNITPISLWFMVYITIVFMGVINQLIARGPHLVQIEPTVLYYGYTKDIHGLGIRYIYKNKFGINHRQLQ